MIVYYCNVPAIKLGALFVVATQQLGLSCCLQMCPEYQKVAHNTWTTLHWGFSVIRQTRRDTCPSSSRLLSPESSSVQDVRTFSEGETFVSLLMQTILIVIISCMCLIIIFLPVKSRVNLVWSTLICCMSSISL